MSQQEVHDVYLFPRGIEVSREGARLEIEVFSETGVAGQAARAIVDAFQGSGLDAGVVTKNSSQLGWSRKYEDRWGQIFGQKPEDSAHNN